MHRTNCCPQCTFWVHVCFGYREWSIGSGRLRFLADDVLYSLGKCKLSAFLVPWTLQCWLTVVVNHDCKQVDLKLQRLSKEIHRESSWNFGCRCRHPIQDQSTPSRIFPRDIHKWRISPCSKISNFLLWNALHLEMLYCIDSSMSRLPDHNRRTGY